MANTLAALLCLLQVATQGLPVSDTAVGQLSTLLNQSTDNEALDENIGEIQRAAVEAGRAAFPVLRSALSSRPRSQRYAAAYAVAFLGESEGPDLLLRQYERSKSDDFRTLACFALASRGSESDISFLIKSLRGEQFGDRWFPIQVAALALGVLRSQAAIEPLRRTASKTPGSIAAGAAGEALRWIEEGPYETDPTGPDDLAPVLAVLRHGVPRITESSIFFESARSRVWVRRQRRWFLERPVPWKNGTPTISFDTFISGDSQRALVSVGLTFGRLNGVGYDYLLRRGAGGWKVIGILPTWIS